MLDILTKFPSTLKIVFFPVFLSFTVGLPLPKVADAAWAEGAENPPGDNFPYIKSGGERVKG